MTGEGRGGYGEGAGRKKNQPKGQRLLNKDGTVGEKYDPKEYQPTQAPITVEQANKKRALELEEEKKQQEAAKKKKKLEEKKKADKDKADRERQEKRELELKEQTEGLNRLQEETEETVNNRNVGDVGGGGGGGGGGDGDDDDEDYFSDEDCDEDDEDPRIVDDIPNNNSPPANNVTNSNSSRQNSRRKPPPGSALDEHLKKKRTEITTEKDPKTDRPWLDTGGCWYPPEEGALERAVDPNHFYNETPLICCFAPSNSRVLPTEKKYIKDYECIHCKKQGFLESNGWCWRPQHMFADAAWVLHQRIVCRRDDKKKGCKKTWAAFHPEFIKQLPNVITERFPFLVAPSGVGIHIAMMDQFLHLATKGIPFTAYSKSINEMKDSKCCRDHLNYLDLLSDRATKEGGTYNHFEDNYVPKPFAPYKSPGKYNGIYLKPSLMKKLFLQVMGALEEHMQVSFQLHPDESEASDHSFKFAKMLMTKSRCGSPYLATYDSISLHGMCTFNRLCHTKSNDELRTFIQLCKKVRINSGALVLKRTEGDGGGDRSVWPLEFPEPKKDTNPYKPSPEDGKIIAKLDPDKCEVLYKKEEVNGWALGVAGNAAFKYRKGKIYYGLDAEWNYDGITSDTTRVITISIPGLPGTKVAVIDLTWIGWFSDDPNDIPHDLKTLLENDRMIPVGVSASGDISRLRQLGIRVKNKIEIVQLAKELNPNLGCYKLCNLCWHYLDYKVDKQHQMSDWREMKERPELQHYAALDAHLHIRLYTKLTNLKNQAKQEGRIATPSIVTGNQAQLTYRNRVCALGKMAFLGGDGGQLTKFGKMTVGKGKAIVKIESVTMQGARPAFPHRHHPDCGFFDSSWEIKDNTLQELLEKHKDLELPWPTGRMKLALPSIEDFLQPPEVADEASVDDANSQQPTVEETVAEGEEEEEEVVVSEDDVAAVDDDLIEDKTDSNKVHCPVAKQFYDRFHVFDNFPASRDEKTKPAYSLIRRLVTMGTLEFDADDLDDVTKFLADNKGTSDWEGLLDDFHCNREWWYQRVRIYPPPPAKGARNIESIKECVEKNPALQEFVTDKPTKYLDDLILLYREGKMSESHEVEMYQFDGKDKYGLSKWLRRRGSNRSENIHQKMRVAFGPHGVGVEVGHCLLLLVSHRYNINTGIRRKGMHNFGTLCYNTIDRIQLRMIQMFGVDVYPTHTNQKLFKPVKGFVAVGVGPLNHNEDYVRKGLPHPNCSGDALFMADRMGLVGPPMHMSHPKEKKIFNDFMQNNPKVSGQSWHKLAKICLEKSDYQTIFPKPPAMLQSYHTKWKATQQVVALKDSISVKYYELLRSLARPAGSDEPMNPAAAFNKESSDENRMQQLAGGDEGDVTMVLPEDVDMDDMPVAPLQAPGQTQYVTSGNGDKRSTVERPCSGICFGCPRKANKCSGRTGGWKKCKLVEADDYDSLPNLPVDGNERQRVFDAYKKEEDRLRKKRERAVKKAEKVAAAAAAVPEEEEEESSV